MPDAEAAANASAYLEACIADNDSAGGVVECIISGMPVGIGDPVFEKLDHSCRKDKEAYLEISNVFYSKLQKARKTKLTCRLNS